MTDTCKLESQTCVPCQGGVPTLTDAQIRDYTPRVPQWKVKDVEGIKRIERVFEFPDFVQAMKFVNKVADLAEAQGHHPDFAIHWNRVTLELWTHKIRGLHENDFIMAAKIDGLE